MSSGSVTWNVYVFRTLRPVQHLLGADAPAHLHFDSMREHYRGAAITAIKIS